MSPRGRLIAPPVVIAALLLAACAPRPAPELTLIREPVGSAIRLRLLPAPGVRINALLAPALERPDRSIHRFDSPSRTPDSSYFTAPPEVVVVGPTRGVVRASVCFDGEAVCRVVEVRSEE